MEEKFEFYNEKLYEKRKSKGMSQDEFAEKLGVSRQSIYAWESGKSLPDIGNLYKMCQALEIEANELTNFAQTEKENKEEVKKSKKKKLKKIIVIVLSIVFIAYLVTVLRQYSMVVDLNEKINSKENYDNYSYYIITAILENSSIEKVITKEVYYKDRILKEITTLEGNKKEIYWRDFRKNEGYNFLEKDGEKTVRKLEAPEIEENVENVSNIINNGLISEKNSYNLLGAIFWPFKHFSYKVESTENCYILKYSTKDNRFNVDTKYIEYIDKSNGFPVEKEKYSDNGKGKMEKYKEIKINETTDEDVKMPDLSEYTFVEE